MRTVVDLPAEQIAALDLYTKQNGISRAEAVRRAVAAFVPKTPAKPQSLKKHPAFGSVVKTGVDSVEMVRELRSEWEPRE